MTHLIFVKYDKYANLILKITQGKESKRAEPPKYRDCAKKHRKYQNLDYKLTDLGFHVVVPPSIVDLRYIILYLL